MTVNTADAEEEERDFLSAAQALFSSISSEIISGKHKQNTNTDMKKTYIATLYTNSMTCMTSKAK